MAGFLVKSALLIAFHFPPVQVSSGLQRTLTNSRKLPEHGWRPLVLSAHPRAYPMTSEGQLRDIPPGTVVERAFALDTGRHLALGGRYPKFLSLPDRWVSWWLGGLITGWRLARRHRPSVIWSTYPIATAHLIGLTLHKLTGIPWVADFRDSMTEPDYPPQRQKRRVYQWIERKTIEHCSRAVFTTPGALEMYRKRYPQFPQDKWRMIANGYDEDIFDEVEANLIRRQSGNIGPTVLLHSGVIYPQERDPAPFFRAVARLSASGAIDASRVRVVLRACGHQAVFLPMLQELGIEDIVQLMPVISYREAIEEIFQADGLIVLQAANCNHQIPAKIYEYFRARRPILALTDPAGDTASTIRKAGIHSIAPLDDASAIADTLLEFLHAIEAGKPEVATPEAVQRSSRAYAVASLAGVFGELS